MARFSEEELDEIRRNTDIVTLIESYGTKLKERPTPNEYLGCCPLHEDETPSLFVNRAKGKWQCKGCGAEGDCFTWVQKAEKVSFPHAVQLLKDKKVGVLAGNGTKAAFARRLDNPIAMTAEDHELLNQVAEYYHSQLKENADALAYLKSRGLDNAEAIDKFKLGFSNRTLGLRMPTNQVKAGKSQRERLTQLGVLKKTGHEALLGCITFPVTIGENAVGEIYGRRIMRGTPKNECHWYLSGPHLGIWNAEAFTCSDEIILCESIIDALTFWIAGFRNVTCSYGNQGFTEELYQAFIKNDIKICFIAWDNDKASNPLALKLAERLMAQGIKCMRVIFPEKTKDANEFAMKIKDGNGTAHGPLSMLLRTSEWLMPKDIDVTKRYVPKSVDQLSSTDSSTAPTQPAPKEESQLATGASEPVTIPTQAVVDEPNKLLLLGAKTPEASAPIAPTQTTTTVKVPTATEPQGINPKVAAPSSVTAEIKDNEIIIELGNRSYRIRGLARNTNGFDSMKVNVLARKGEAFFVDTLDIYAARGRNAFIKEASRELALEEEIIKRDLGKVLLKLEELQDSLALKSVESKKIEITELDKAKALEFLKSDRLVERILADFDACGVIGEQTNKLFGYIAGTSRKLDKPLAMMVQSSSAAGKSSLMEAVLGFMPPEEQISYSAMTGQSLFYMGAMNLKNKILAISEEEGIRQAAYALKLLQSDGKLTIASTGKDPGTGRMETQEYHVEGPVMLFLTTTAIDVDPELMNRCTVLTVNEDREQTAAILQQQRKEETLEGMQSHHRKIVIRAIHHNAQRLLRPLGVVNPFAEELGFLDSQTRFRRDHKKYLTLIRAVALLHQYQREIKTTTIEGQVLEYIEVTHQDIVLANRLADAVLGRSIDELSPQSRRLLWQLIELVREEMETKQLLQSEVRFTRKQIRDRYGWGQTQLKLHLDKLVEMEYVMAHKTGARLVEYELLYDGRGREGQPTLPGLIDPSKKGPPTLPLTITSSAIIEPSSAPNSSISGTNDGSSGEHRPNIGPMSNEEKPTLPNENKDQNDMGSKT